MEGPRDPRGLRGMIHVYIYICFLPCKHIFSQSYSSHVCRTYIIKHSKADAYKYKRKKARFQVNNVTADLRVFIIISSSSIYGCAGIYGNGTTYGCASIYSSGSRDCYASIYSSDIRYCCASMISSGSMVTRYGIYIAINDIII